PSRYSAETPFIDAFSQKWAAVPEGHFSQVFLHMIGFDQLAGSARRQKPGSPEQEEEGTVDNSRQADGQELKETEGFHAPAAQESAGGDVGGGPDTGATCAKHCSKGHGHEQLRSGNLRSAGPRKNRRHAHRREPRHFSPRRRA